MTAQAEGSSARDRDRVDTALAGLMDAAGAGPLADAARYAVDAGGKRLRPILCIAGYRAVDGPDTVSEPVYRLAAAIELTSAVAGRRPTWPTAWPSPRWRPPR